MIAFWILFLIPLFALLMPGRLPERQARWAWFAIGTIFAVMMGFRHEVGADWFNYLPHFRNAARADLAEVLEWGDPGYYVLNWVASRLGGDLHWVNFVTAAVLMWGTVVFCRRQPNPWLALLAAVPYMLIVVGMGYTRQAGALGFALLGLSALGDGRVRAFVLWVILGALFHKSAVLLLPIAALANTRNKWLTGALVMGTTGLMYYLLIADRAEALWNDYVDAEMQSQGGLIRVVMNAVPAVLMLVFRNRLVADPVERRLWICISLFALACLPLVGMSSTAVDRVALYFIPLQLFVFSRMPRLAASAQSRTPLTIGIIGYYAAVQFVWLNYATHAEYWVPYKFIPL